jgi:hypothetical protein
VIIPTQQELLKNNKKNGEGSLVRFRMAGCGLVDSSSKPFSFFCEKKETSFPKKEKQFIFANAKENGEILDPRSFIFMLLSEQPLTQKQLAQRLGLTTRAVRYILSRLLKEKIILQRASLLDARSKFYYLNSNLDWLSGIKFRSARQSYYEVNKK